MASKNQTETDELTTQPLLLKKKTFRDILPLEEAKPPIVSSKNCVNLSFILVDFTEREMGEQYKKGDLYTKWYLLECLNDKNEQVFISAGGYVICRQIDAVNKVEDLPLKFTFKLDKDGKTMYLD